MTTEPPRRRPTPATATSPPTSPEPAPPAPRPERKADVRPYLLDFYPLESEGRLSTTRCRTDGLLWPPRTACPTCHTEDLEWVDLPDRGRLYAFSAVLAGAPLGMETEVPFSVGLVDLDGVPLRLYGRVEGRPWNALRIGLEVRVEPYPVGDGRFFYRFRAVE